MGRQAFSRFLAPRQELVSGPEPGVRWGADAVSWDRLLKRGRARSDLVQAQRAYVVDPTAGIEALASLFAVATVPDTMLLWAAAKDLGRPARHLAPGLYEIDPPVPGPIVRPLWGVATSGSSGNAKIAIGHADVWELVALHYERAMFQQGFTFGPPSVLATCLPLQFSAAFFMTVLPAMFLRRDLVVHPSHDWSVVKLLARERSVFVLSVPTMAAAACVGTGEPVAMDRVTVFLGGGHVTSQRVSLIRDRFRGITVANLYGTAETGAISVDLDPGHNQHVGHPIAGKAVWLEGPNDKGIGTVAVAGPDCCRFVWRPGRDLVATGEYVASTDYGRFDEEGHLCLEGRVDGGEKLTGAIVYPRAIERHLLSLDGVADVRVQIRRSENGLERLAARVVGTVDEATVREHCVALPEIERPTLIELISERDAATAYSANGKL